MEIKIEYDGEYPNLCSGRLFITIDGTRWDFGTHNIASGGDVWFDENWMDHVEYGPWTVTKWPEGFPDKMKGKTMKAINESIHHGCCGGCI